MAIYSKNRTFLFIYNQIGASLKVKTSVTHHNSLNTLICIPKSSIGYATLARSVKRISLKNAYPTKYPSEITNQLRYQSSQSAGNENAGEKKQGFFKTSILYSFSVVLGGIFGVITGYWLMSDESQLDDANESTRSFTPTAYESTKSVSEILIVNL